MVIPGPGRGAARAEVVLALGCVAPRRQKCLRHVPSGHATRVPLSAGAHRGCVCQRHAVLHLAGCLELKGSQHLAGGSFHRCQWHTLSLAPGVPTVPLGEEGPPVSLQLRQPHRYSVPARWQLAGWQQSDSGDR